MELYELTIKQAADLLKHGKCSSMDITASCLDRIESVDKKVNALITVCREKSLKSAEESDKRRKEGNSFGVLDGIPGIIKDNISTRHIRTTAGSKMLAEYIPVFDAHVVEKLYNEGFVLMGKANMDEFAMGSSTENSALKKTHNPWNVNCVPGGSSGGSTASVAADEAMFSLGSDTGGSIRQPAGFCGVVGMKPTYSTVSRYGLIAFASSLDQIGPVTKTVEDNAIVLNAISGCDCKDSTSARIEYPDYTRDLNKSLKGVKIGIPKEYMAQQIDADVRNSFEKSVDLLDNLGCIISEISLPTFDYALSAYYVISSAECASNLARFDGIRYGYRAEKYNDLNEMYLNTRTFGFGPEVKRRIMLGNYVLSSGYYDAYYLKALKVRTLIKNDFRNQFDNIDAIVSPVSPTPAFRHNSKASPLDMYLSDLFTVPVNIAGLTAISIPSGLSSDGLPIGFQIIADAFCEQKLYNIANMLEKEINFADKPKIR